MRRIDKLDIQKANDRGFLCIRITDRYGTKIRVQQSSVCLTDVWFFIEEKGVLSPYEDLLLTYDNIKDISAFESYLRKNC